MTTDDETIRAVVVDTDVVSYLIKSDSRARLYRRHLMDRTLVLSPMTLAELERWALSANWGADRRRSMEDHLRRYVFAPFSRQLCLKWAEATDAASRRGYVVSCADAWVAAVALLNQIPLVTHNAADYRGIDHLEVLTARA